MNSTDDRWRVEVFYDGACPLCLREIEWIRRRDSARSIRFTDIASPDFATADLSVSMADLMARIHGRYPDGTLIEGVEVFRQLYTAIGFGWIVRITRWPMVRHCLDMLYTVFARNRLRFTGRCHPDSGCRTDTSRKHG